MVLFHIKTSTELEPAIKDLGEESIAVLEFGASWCHACSIMKPRFERVAEVNPVQTFAFIDVDDCEDLALEYNVFVLPTTYFIRNKAIIETIIGADIDLLYEVLSKFKMEIPVKQQLILKDTTITAKESTEQPSKSTDDTKTESEPSQSEQEPETSKSVDEHTTENSNTPDLNGLTNNKDISNTSVINKLNDKSNDKKDTENNRKSVHEKANTSKNSKTADLNSQNLLLITDAKDISNTSGIKMNVKANTKNSKTPSINSQNSLPVINAKNMSNTSAVKKINNKSRDKDFKNKSDPKEIKK